MYYSEHDPSILISYFLSFGTFIGLIVAFISFGVWEIKQYIESKKIGDLLGSIFFMVCVVALVFTSVPCFKDIPNVINKNYITITGTVIEPGFGGRDLETRTPMLLTDDGERVSAVVVYTPFARGERYEIVRLPNTGIGYVVRKIE